MSTDLIAFLRARLDEDEAIAQRALDSLRAEVDAEYHPDAAAVIATDPLSPGRWHVDPNGPQDEDVGRDVENAAGATIVQTESGFNPPKRVVCDHIARHDLVRVLADVAAKRKIIDLHAPVVLRPGAEHGLVDRDRVVCRSCEPERGGLGDAWPCQTLRLLALPWADHPDFKATWRPQ